MKKCSCAQVPPGKVVTPTAVQVSRSSGAGSGFLLSAPCRFPKGTVLDWIDWRIVWADNTVSGTVAAHLSFSQQYELDTLETSGNIISAHQTDTEVAGSATTTRGAVKFCGPCLSVCCELVYLHAYVSGTCGMWVTAVLGLIIPDRQPLPRGY